MDQRENFEIVKTDKTSTKRKKECKYETCQKVKDVKKHTEVVNVKNKKNVKDVNCEKQEMSKTAEISKI